MAKYLGNWFFGDNHTGTSGADEIYGYGGNDVLNGGGGNDRIYGGDHDDLIYGGDGRDTLYGENGDDRIYGGDGNDTLDGGGGDDLLRGGEGDDMLYGNAGDDDMEGGAGNDTFVDYMGANSFNGGAGIDTLDYSHYAGRINVTLADGNASATVGREYSIYHVGAGTRFYRDDSDTVSAVENIKGGTGGDTITGNILSNVIEGNGGSDKLTGGGGYDTLSGGSGQDFFIYDNGDAPLPFTSAAGVRTAEKILDFNYAERDYLDLRPMDSSPRTPEENSFTWVDQFTGFHGQLRIVQDSATQFRVFGDTDGNGIADFNIDITTVGATTIQQMQWQILL